MVFLPLLYPDLFERFKVQPPRGVLFYGPPGTDVPVDRRALTYCERARSVNERKQLLLSACHEPHEGPCLPPLCPIVTGCHRFI
eukprot:1138839-Pelagomonas_calceolata.AAC.1